MISVRVNEIFNYLRKDEELRQKPSSTFPCSKLIITAAKDVDEERKCPTPSNTSSPNVLLNEDTQQAQSNEIIDKSRDESKRAALARKKEKRKQAKKRGKQGSSEITSNDHDASLSLPNEQLDKTPSECSSVIETEKEDVLQRLEVDTGEEERRLSNDTTPVRKSKDKLEVVVMECRSSLPGRDFSGLHSVNASSILRDHTTEQVLLTTTDLLRNYLSSTDPILGQREPCLYSIGSRADEYWMRTTEQPDLVEGSFPTSSDEQPLVKNNRSCSLDSLSESTNSTDITTDHSQDVSSFELCSTSNDEERVEVDRTERVPQGKEDTDEDTMTPSIDIEVQRPAKLMTSMVLDANKEGSLLAENDGVAFEVFSTGKAEVVLRKESPETIVTEIPIVVNLKETMKSSIEKEQIAGKIEMGKCSIVGGKSKSSRRNAERNNNPVSEGRNEKDGNCSVRNRNGERLGKAVVKGRKCGTGERKNEDCAETPVDLKCPANDDGGGKGGGRGSERRKYGSPSAVAKSSENSSVRSRGETSSPKIGNSGTCPLKKQGIADLCDFDPIAESLRTKVAVGGASMGIPGRELKPTKKTEGWKEVKRKHKKILGQGGIWLDFDDVDSDESSSSTSAVPGSNRHYDESPKPPFGKNATFTKIQSANVAGITIGRSCTSPVKGVSGKHSPDVGHYSSHRRSSNSSQCENSPISHSSPFVSNGGLQTSGEGASVVGRNTMRYSSAPMPKTCTVARAGPEVKSDRNIQGQTKDEPNSSYSLFTRNFLRDETSAANSPSGGMSFASVAANGVAKASCAVTGNMVVVSPKSLSPDERSGLSNVASQDTISATNCSPQSQANCGTISGNLGGMAYNDLVLKAKAPGYKGPMPSSLYTQAPTSTVAVPISVPTGRAAVRPIGSNPMPIRILNRHDKLVLPMDEALLPIPLPRGAETSESNAMRSIPNGISVPHYQVPIMSSASNLYPVPPSVRWRFDAAVDFSSWESAKAAQFRSDPWQNAPPRMDSSVLPKVGHGVLAGDVCKVPPVNGYWDALDNSLVFSGKNSERIETAGSFSTTAGCMDDCILTGRFVPPAVNYGGGTWTYCAGYLDGTQAGSFDGGFFPLTAWSTVE